ncbi:hypothetical protein GIB67_038463 [Kingdonia uniflora]|uniref:Uncharacterized protein n=1 Tax=Kingdonia uniflora TaxID=39325 RepID=A0A7J7NP76_9MAGN|nr:hypothetical protein GIB67_038463 [Kingdonia uniflora]
MILEEKIASEAQGLKLKYFGDQSLEMVVPAPVPPMYRGLLGEEAVEAEEYFYYKWFGLLHLYQLCGGGGYRRGSDGSGGGKLYDCASAEPCEEVFLLIPLFSLRQGVKSTVERKESLLDKVVEEETELELFSSTEPYDEQDSPQTSEETDKKGFAGPCSGEKVAEGRSILVDDLKEVEERAKLTILQGKEDTSQMVARLVEGIWLGIEEQKFELKQAKSELEKNLARTKTDALKEAKQLKAAHAEVDAIKVDTYVEEEEEEAGVLGVVDGLDGISPQTVLDNQGDDVELPEDGSEKAVKKMSLRINNLEYGLAMEIQTSKALLYAQAELEVDALAPKGMEADMAQYRIRALERTEELCRSGLNSCRIELEGMRQKCIPKDDELRVARENLSASEAAAEHL